MSAHDSWAPAYRGDLWNTVGGADAAVAMVAHEGRALVRDRGRP